MRHGELGYKWTDGELTYKKPLKYIDLYNENLATSTLTRKIDHAIFADDAIIDIAKIEYIYPKLLMYNAIADRNSLEIQWGEVLPPKKTYIKLNYFLTIYPGLINL